MGQPSQNGPLTVQPFRSLLSDIMKAPFVVPTSIVTPSWFIAVALWFLDHALSYMSCTLAAAALYSRARLLRKADLHRLRFTQCEDGPSLSKQEIATRKMGPTVNLRCKKSPARMAVMGHKRTFRSAITMSALPPKTQFVASL